MSKFQQLAKHITDRGVSISAVQRHLKSIEHVADAMQTTPAIEQGQVNYSLVFRSGDGPPYSKELRFTFSKLEKMGTVYTSWLDGKSHPGNTGRLDDLAYITEKFEWFYAD